MYLRQLKDLRESDEIRSVAGVDANATEFRSMANQACRRLIDRGNWFGTEQILHICAYNGCLTWPRIVQTVLGIRSHCGGQIDIRNNWWQILGPLGCDEHFRFDHTMMDNDFSPLFNNITGGFKEIRVFPTVLEDVGKQITVFGTDSNNNMLQQKVSGVWQPGLTIKIGNPYGSSLPTFISKIDKVVKDRTQSQVQLYEYDATSQTLRDLAFWSSDETHPRYRRSIVRNMQYMGGCPSQPDGLKIHKFDALVKLAFIPVHNDYDFLAIDDFTALAFMFAAIRLEQANEDQAAEVKIRKAIEQLNFVDRNSTPYQQTVVRIAPVGIGIANPI